MTSTRIIKNAQQMKPYGLMFHHFYDAKHPKGQGAISEKELE